MMNQQRIYKHGSWGIAIALIAIPFFGCSRFQTTDLQQLIDDRPGLPELDVNRVDILESVENNRLTSNQRDRNFKLADVKQIAFQDEISPADSNVLEQPTQSQEPKPLRPLAGQGHPPERIIVLAAQTPDTMPGNPVTTPTQNLLPQRPTHSLSPIARGDSSQEPNRLRGESEPKSIRPDLDATTKPMEAPAATSSAHLKANAKSNSNTNTNPNADANPNAWPSEAAGKYEQPGSQVVSDFELENENSFLMPLDIFTSDCRCGECDPCLSRKADSIAATEPPNLPDSVPPFANCPPLEIMALAATPPRRSEGQQVNFETDVAPEMAKEEAVAQSGSPNLDDWKQKLNNLVEALDYQINAPTFENLPTESRNQIEVGFQLLKALQQSEPEATSNVAMTPEQQAMSRKHAQIIRELLPDLIQSEFGMQPATNSEEFHALFNRLQEATDSLSAMSSLKLNHPTFCTRISGFGQVEEVASKSFAVGQRLLVYCEVENFICRFTESTRDFRTHLKGRFSIYNERNEPVQTVDFSEVEDVAKSRRHDFYIHLPVTIADLPTGQYHLQVTITDLGGNKMASLDEPLLFEVK